MIMRYFISWFCLVSDFLYFWDITQAAKKQSAFAAKFNYDNNEQLIKSIEQKHLNNIKPLSIKKQKIEYQKILENIDDYRSCCPEYIKQAKAFFKIKKFNTFADLAVEIYPKDIFLHITLMGQNGEK